MLVYNDSLVKYTIIGKYHRCYFNKVQCKSLAVTISNSDYVKKSRMGLSNSRLATPLVKSRFVKLNIRYQTTQKHKRLPPCRCLISDKRMKKLFYDNLRQEYSRFDETAIHKKNFPRSLPILKNFPPFPGLPAFFPHPGKIPLFWQS